MKLSLSQYAENYRELHIKKIKKQTINRMDLNVVLN